MGKYWGGVSFERRKIKEGGKERDVVVAMTDKEYDDRSHREYLWESQREKFRDEVSRMPAGNPSKKAKAREEIASMLKEYSEYRRRKQESPNRKYF